MNYNAAVNISAQFTGQAAVEAAKRGVGDLKKSFDLSSLAMHQMKDLAKEFGAAIAAAFAVEKVFEYGKGIIELGEQMEILRSKTGIGVQELSNLKTASELNGVAFDQTQVAIKKFVENVSLATHGGREAEAAFKALKISVKDLKDPGEALLKVADKFSEMNNGADKASLARRLFGRGGTDVIPVLNAGREEIEKFGVKISDDFARRAEHFNRTLALMKSHTQQLGVSIMTEALPALQDLADAWLALNKSSGKDGPVNGVDLLVEAFRQLGVVVIAVFQTLAAAVDIVIAAFKSFYNLLELVGKQLINLRYLGEAFMKGLTGDVEGASAATRKYMESSSRDTQAYFEKNRKIGSEFFDQMKKRHADYAESVAKANRSSILFGNRGKNDHESSAGHGRRGPDTEGLEALNAEIRAVEDKIKKIRAEAVELNSSNAAKRLSIEMAELNAKSIDKSSAAYKRLAAGLKEAVYAAEASKDKQAAADFQKKQTQELELRKLELNQIEYTTAEYRKLTAHKKLDLEVTEATKRMTQEGAQAYREAAQAIREQTDALIDLQEQQQRSFGQGARDAWHDYLENAKNVAAQTKQMFTRAFSNMEDAIVKFVKTGELSFAQLADAIEEDLIRISIRQAVVFGTNALFGGGTTALPTSGGQTLPATGGMGTTFSANGNIMTEHGPLALKKYAKGGVARSPQLSIFGEGSMPEAYVPLPDHRTIPVTLTGAVGGSVSVQVYVQTDGSAKSQVSGDGDQESGRKLGQMIANAVKTTLVQEKRPGGLLAAGA